MRFHIQSWLIMQNLAAVAGLGETLYSESGPGKKIWVNFFHLKSWLFYYLLMEIQSPNEQEASSLPYLVNVAHKAPNID